MIRRPRTHRACAGEPTAQRQRRVPADVVTRRRRLVQGTRAPSFLPPPPTGHLHLLRGRAVHLRARPTFIFRQLPTSTRNTHLEGPATAPTKNNSGWALLRGSSTHRPRPSPRTTPAKARATDFNAATLTLTLTLTLTRTGFNAATKSPALSAALIRADTHHV
jgi:hypothetical protein